MMIKDVFRKAPLTALLGLGMSCWGINNAIAKPIHSPEPTPNPAAICATVKPLTGVIQPIASVTEENNLGSTSPATHFCAEQLTEISPAVSGSTFNLGESTEPSPEAGFNQAINEPEPQLPAAIAQTSSQQSPSQQSPSQQSSSQPNPSQPDPNQPNPVEEPTPSSEEISPQADNPPWRFSFMPYATIPVSVYGTNVIRGRSLNYHMGLGTLLEKLKVLVSARAEAWNGNLGLIFDGYYVSLGGTGIQQTDRPNIDTTLTSSLSFQQGIYDFALSYHLGDRPVAYDPKKPSNSDFPIIWFQPIIGTRLNQLDSTIETTLAFNRIGRVFENSVSAGRTWFEPLVGGKLGLQVSDPLTLWLRGDASGFGLAGETDLSWNVFFGADWWVNRSLSLSLSYRFYEIRYGNGTGKNAFRFNENFNGPTLAATFHF